MFNNSKYTKCYFNIINLVKSKQRNKTKLDSTDYIYYENHHILPKSLGGSNLKDNLILLTAREHFICHLLLCKMQTNAKSQWKMILAFRRMSNKLQNNSHIYSMFKEEFIKNHPLKGKLKAEETKQNMKDSFTEKRRKIISERLKVNNPNNLPGAKERQSAAVSGNKNPCCREDVKIKLRGPRPNFKPHNQINGWDELTKNKISGSLQGHIRSKESKEKQKQTLKNNPKMWIHKQGVKALFIKKSELEIYLKENYIIGRGKIK